MDMALIFLTSLLVADIIAIIVVARKYEEAGDD